MAGNAWEWCLEIWRPDELADGFEDPLFPWKGEGPTHRIVRGGSFNSSQDQLHTASRLPIDITTAPPKTFGFRPTWSVKR